MFWALVIEPNKRYTQVVSKSFHVSMACMDLDTADNEVTSVMLEVGDEKLILCNLSKNKYIQQPLDLNFQIGDEISFYSKGKASIHLTGYLIIGDDFPGLMSDQESEEDDDEEEEDEEEEDAKERLKALASKAMKRGIEEKSSKNKKPRLETLGEGDDSDEDDEDYELAESSSEEGESEEEDDSQLASAGSDSEEDSDEAMEVSKVDALKEGGGKKGKKQKKQEEGGKKGEEGPKGKKASMTPKREEKAGGDKKAESVNGKPTLSAKKKKQKDSGTPKAKGDSTPKTPKADEMQKKTLPGGVAIEDLKIGNGPAAKPGRMVTVYYVGRLKHNNKQFDSTQQGPGFKFRLGNNEVIKGWDLGVSGMKVGGKRKIVCPPNMAYGSKGSPPVIPPNSSLVFEVELKNIN